MSSMVSFIPLSQPWDPKTISIPPTSTREHHQPTSTIDITVQRQEVEKLLAIEIKQAKAEKSTPDSKDERLEIDREKELHGCYRDS